MGGTKTLEGSLACFLVAFACCAAVLGTDASVLTLRLAVISLGAAALATLLEAVAWAGLDNVLVPLGVWAYLTFIYA